MADEFVGPYQIPQLLADENVARVSHSKTLATAINAGIAQGKGEAVAHADGIRWERVTVLTANDVVDNLPSGLYQVRSGTVATALGLPTAQAGSLWIHRLDTAGTMIRREWRPTPSMDIWGQRKHGATQTAWAIAGVRSTGLTSSEVVETLPTALYSVLSANAATALGLPTATAGSLWIHRMAADAGRMEWRPTASTDVWHRRLHGTDWHPWVLPAPPRPPVTPGDPGGDEGEIEGVSLTLEDTGQVMVPTSIGTDGFLYGYDAARNRPVRSGDSLATAPEQGPTIPGATGRGIAHVERTSTGYVVVFEHDATSSSVWHSETWAGPYTRVLDMSSWHFTSRAKSRLVAGSTWMLLGEYTNAILPSWPMKRYLSTDGGKTWKHIKTTTVNKSDVNSHSHTAMIRADGRLYVSEGDGSNNWFGYSDDQGVSWVPVPTDPAIQIDAPYYSQPTTLIDFGDRIALSPDRGRYQPGMWTMDPNTHKQRIVWELKHGGPYADASKQYGRSVFAQAGPTGSEAYVMFPPGGSGTATAYIAATPDAGRRWGVVASIPIGEGTLNTGVHGPDRNGNLFMRGAGIPTYGGNVIRAKLINWTTA